MSEIWGIPTNGWAKKTTFFEDFVT